MSKFCFLGVSSAQLHNGVLLLTWCDGVDSVRVVKEILDHQISFFNPVAVAKGLEQDTSSGQYLVAENRFDVVVDNHVHSVDELLWHHHRSLLGVLKGLHSHFVTVEG